MRTSITLLVLGFSTFGCAEAADDPDTSNEPVAPNPTEPASGTPSQPSPSATSPAAPTASTPSPTVTGPGTVAPTSMPTPAPTPTAAAPTSPTQPEPTAPQPSDTSPAPENTSPEGTGGSGGAPAPTDTGGAGGEPEDQTGGAGGSGGSPEESDFNPCPALPDPCKVLPLGDSITEGMDGANNTAPLGQQGGYRLPLFNLAREGNKNLTFVGGRMGGPESTNGTPFPRNHEGYSGYTIQQIDNLVPGILSPNPHIVLLHLGTNDMIGQNAGSAPQRLATLIDEIIETLPDSLLVVSTLIPLGFGNAAVQTYNATLPALVEERASRGAHVLLVDQFTGFPSSEMPDQVHPNAAGYARMAGVWYTAIESYLR